MKCIYIIIKMTSLTVTPHLQLPRETEHFHKQNRWYIWISGRIYSRWDVMTQSGQKSELCWKYPLLTVASIWWGRSAKALQVHMTFWEKQMCNLWSFVVFLFQKPANILVMGEGPERGRVKIGKNLLWFSGLQYNYQDYISVLVQNAFN